MARDIEITISVYIQQQIAKIAQLVEHDLAPKDGHVPTLARDIEKTISVDIQ